MCAEHVMGWEGEREKGKRRGREGMCKIIRARPTCFVVYRRRRCVGLKERGERKMAPELSLEGRGEMALGWRRQRVSCVWAQFASTRATSVATRLSPRPHLTSRPPGSRSRSLHSGRDKQSGGSSREWAYPPRPLWNPLLPNGGTLLS